MPKKWTTVDTKFWTAPEDDEPPAEPRQSRKMTWEERAAFSERHPWKCDCGLCDGTGDLVGTTKVLGVLVPLEKEEVS